MASTLVFVLSLIAIVFAVNASACDESACLRPVRGSNSVFDLIPWSNDVTSQCSKQAAFLQCVSSCASEGTQVSLAKAVLSTLCGSDASGVLSSPCATSYSKRSDLFEAVTDNCHKHKGCENADAIKTCMGDQMQSVCGSAMKTFYDSLWAAAGSDCDTKYSFADKIYSAYTPIIL